VLEVESLTLEPDKISAGLSTIDLLAHGFVGDPLGERPRPVGVVVGREGAASPCPHDVVGIVRSAREAIWAGSTSLRRQVWWR